MSRHRQLEAMTGVAPESIEGFDPSRVLFVGRGKVGAPCWYRCALPALFMGADWIGLSGTPPKVRFETGLVKGQTILPAFDSYQVVVIQQPAGRGWLKIIRDLQDRGVRVIFEVDDHLHGIRKVEGHDYRQGFGKEQLAELELNMRVCDAMICSTEYVARRYRSFNRRTHVCENGLDLGRYALTRPTRPGVNLGWAGGTGHTKAVIPWFKQVARVMKERDNTSCVTIGEKFADALAKHFPKRALSVPWCPIDIYPGAMTLFDIALAPAGRGTFFAGKSDLRWVEAGALGIPTIGDPFVYKRIEQRVTGMRAETAEEAGDAMLELIDDEKLRLELGSNAQEYVRSSRGMQVLVHQWERVFNEVLSR